MADSSAQRKIFIGGLSYGTDDDKLKKYFGAYGQVQDAVVMKDPVSRRSRGFGFITFCDIDSVDNALAHEPHTIDARKVEAKRAVPRSEVKETSTVTIAPAKTSSSETNTKKTIPSSSNSNGTASLATVATAKNGITTKVVTTTISATQTHQTTSTTQAMIQDVSRHATDPRINMDEYAYNKVFVGGLHYDTRDAEFRTYFEKYGKVLTAEVMFNRETHKSRGFGFIVFELEEGAEGVCAEKEHIIDGKVVEVKRAIPRNKLPTTPGTVGTTASTITATGGRGVVTTAGRGVGDVKKSTSIGNTVASKITTASTLKAVSPTRAKVPSVVARSSPATSYAAALKAGVGNVDDEELESLSSSLDQMPVGDISRPPRSNSEPVVSIPNSLSFDFMPGQIAPTDLAEMTRHTSLSFDHTQPPLLPPATQPPSAQSQFASSGVGSSSADSIRANPTPNAWMTAPPASVVGNSAAQRPQGTDGANSLGTSLGWLSSPLSQPLAAPVANLDQGIHSQGSLDNFQSLSLPHVEVANGTSYTDMHYQQQYPQYQQQRGMNPFSQQMYANGRVQDGNPNRFNPNYQQGDWGHSNANPEGMLDQYAMQQGQYQQYPPQQFQQQQRMMQYQQYPQQFQQQPMYEMNHRGLMGQVPYRGNMPHPLSQQQGNNSNGLINLGRLGEEVPVQGDGSELFTFSELRLDSPEFDPHAQGLRWLGNR